MSLTGPVCTLKFFEGDLGSVMDLLEMGWLDVGDGLVRDGLASSGSSAVRRAQECCCDMCGCSILIYTIFYWFCF